MNHRIRTINPISYWRSFTVLIVLEFFSLALFYIVVMLLRSSIKNSFIDIKFSLETFQEDVLKFGFRSSLYDVMFVVLWRMLVLMVAYTACRSTIRLAILLTVLLSTVYIAVKIILSLRDTFSYIVLLEYAFLFISLVSHWFALIFFEILYQPAESHVPFPKGFLSYYDKYINKSRPIYIGYGDIVPDERQPLINNTTLSNESIQSEREEFHSPNQSLRASPVTARNSHAAAEPIVLNEEDRFYKNIGDECVQVVSNLMTSNGWQEETTANNIVCYSKKRDIGKIYKCQGELPVNATRLFNKLYDEVVYQSNWNNDVAQIQILRTIDDESDLIYLVSSKPLGGVIQQRDFVHIRTKAVKNGTYYIVGRSVDFPGCPPKPGLIRGENGPGGYVIQPILTRPNACNFTWILDTSLKGWLSQHLIDRILSSVLTNLFLNLTTYVQQEIR